jgi:hypothetical protein
MLVGYKKVSSLIEEPNSIHMGINYGARDKVGGLQKCIHTTRQIYFNTPQILEPKYTQIYEPKLCPILDASTSV